MLFSDEFGLDVRQWVNDRAQQVGPDWLPFPPPLCSLIPPGNLGELQREDRKEAE